ncbi:transposase [Granulosicoccus antarcticus]|uniref:transposase n=1 Tax=Granulosicoccus antarcticus TaxID=437505 RepID=UPI00197A7035|nr:transposase [Granulosicoccus antarcticus]
MSKQKSGNTRRTFSDEYKAEVVDLIKNGNKPFSLVCKCGHTQIRRPQLRGVLYGAGAGCATTTES